MATVTSHIDQFDSIKGKFVGKFYVWRMSSTNHHEYLHHDGKWHECAGESGSWASEEEAREFAKSTLFPGP